MQFHLIFVCIEVVYGVFRSVERLDLRHSKLCRKREVQHPGCEWGFGLLHQGVHRDWSSALYCILPVVEFSLDVPEPLLPRPLLCLLLIKDGPIAFVVPAMPLLVAILSGGLVRTMLPGVTSFSLSTCFSMRVEVLFFSGNKYLAFSGLSHLLGHCICLVSFSNSLSKRWLVIRSASTSSVLTCIVSSVPPGGRLSTSPG